MIRNRPYGFVAGTLVHTPGGTVPIQEIQPGDWVLSSGAGIDSKISSRSVLSVDIFSNVEIWNLTIQRQEAGLGDSQEDFILLSSHQPLGIMGQRAFDRQANSWAEMRILPMTNYLGHPAEEWFLASDLYDSAGVVLCTSDCIGVDVIESHPLFTMNNPSWAWGSTYYVEEMVGKVYDLSQNHPIRLANSMNDLDLNSIADEGKASSELYPYFCHPIYALRVEGENSYFVGTSGCLSQGLPA